MIFRRSFFKTLLGIFPLTYLNHSNASNEQSIFTGENRDYYRELGIQPFINAAGAYSVLGGARMREETIDAMNYAAINKVKIRDLHDAVGQEISNLTGAEAAMVTSGATASIVLGTAACMTLGDEKKMQQLPGTDGIKNEIIIQKQHRYTYDKALTVAGGKLIEIETKVDLYNSINDRTAMLFFLKSPYEEAGIIQAKEYIAISKEMAIPCFCDAATTTPPASNVIEGIQEGFDLICYSGGKGLRGPYSAGLLLGRKDLIGYAKRHSAPNDISIGRGMKVSAEEYLGMLVALESALKVSKQEEQAYKKARFQNIENQISDIKSVKTEIFESDSITDELYLKINWDEKIIPLSKENFIESLRNSSPSIEVRLLLFSKGEINLSATVMREGEDMIVGRTIRNILIKKLKLQ
jgi:L-seryl-tRNA(Ser) seleniumtransferase